jgi:hypothetical protein
MIKKGKRIKTEYGEIVLQSDKIRLYNEGSVIGKSFLFIGIFMEILMTLALVFGVKEYLLAIPGLALFVYLIYRFGLATELQLDFQKKLIEKRKMWFDKPLSKKTMNFDPSLVKFQIIGPFLHVMKGDSNEFVHYFLIMKTSQEEFRLSKFSLLEDAIDFRKKANEYYEKELIEDRSKETCDMSYW